MYVIQRVGLGSCFKVGFVASALMTAIFGAIGVVFYVLLSLLSVVAVSGSRGGGDAAGAIMITVVGVCCGYIISIFVYGILGGIFTFIYGAIYNFAAGRVGGLELQLERIGGAADPRKPKEDVY